MPIHPLASDEPLLLDPGFRQACDLLRSGQPVAVPTETVYGLAADASSPEACARIFALKGRPRFNPLISHLPDSEAALRQGEFDQRALALAEMFWPGPLTLVVPRRPRADVCDLATAGLDSVALRVPDAPVMQALATELGRPLAAPSANRSGRISPTTANAVAEEFGPTLPLVLDAGPTRVGVESTILALLGDEPQLLRPGGVPREALEAALGRPLGNPTTDDSHPRAPGMLSSHYAPRAQVRLDAENRRRGEAYLAFGPVCEALAQAPGPLLNLSASGNLIEAAANLFAHLRALDATGVTSIAVAPIPQQGLGEAINDRLARAAADRPANGIQSL